MDEVDSILFRCLDEQAAVNFTGKVNVLGRLDHRLLGVVTLKEGAVHACDFLGVSGLKAFHAMLVREYCGDQISFVVEPEIVQEDTKNIHFPLAVLKDRAMQALKRYRAVAASRPPPRVRLLVRPAFLESAEEVSSLEFQVLCNLSEWSGVEDLYKNSPLLEHEITEALVGLRKKDALEVVSLRTQGP